MDIIIQYQIFFDSMGAFLVSASCFLTGGAETRRVLFSTLTKTRFDSLAWPGERRHFFEQTHMVLLN